MKKILIVFAFMLGFFCSCTNCSNGSVEPIQNDSAIVVDAIINSDFEDMFSKYGKDDFRFYECDILLKNFLDEEYDGVTELVNIYQVITSKDSTSFDTEVYKIQHFPGGQALKDSVKGFWIENFPIDTAEIKVSYDSAFTLINKVNLPKPHSRHVTLKKPIGPIACNTQWIFGNTHSQLWVDATTGDIKESNPAFPEAFKMPLGEWP